MAGLIQVHEYFDATEAQVARARLVSLGVTAEVFVDDLGRQGPSHGRLMVASDQVEEACEVLGLDPPGEREPGFLERNAALLLLAIVALAAAGLISWLAG